MSELERIGPYRIVRQLGKGGMGRVYEAVNEHIQRRAAIKVLHEQFAENPQVVQRFLNEARAVNIVKHRCLVDIYEFGQLESGAAYIIMEYLDGLTLHERLWHAGGKLSVELALRYGRQIALALAAAHAKGIIHRDLKPANIMLVEDPETGEKDWIKVLDFGLARVREPGAGEEGRLTQSGMLMGTPAYMSPEQIRSARSAIDKSDVYSLGVLLFEMLSGQKPFVAGSDAETMFLHLSQPVPSLKALIGGLAPGLYTLVERMLAKNPDDRPTANETAMQLAVLSGRRPSGQIAQVPLPQNWNLSAMVAPTEMDKRQDRPWNRHEAATQPGTQRVPGWNRSQHWIVLLGVLLTLVLALLVWVIRERQRPKLVPWNLDSTPSEAQVMDAQQHVLGLTPLRLSQPIGTEQIELTIKKAGFGEARVICTYSAPCVEAVQLPALSPPAVLPMPNGPLVPPPDAGTPPGSPADGGPRMPSEAREGSSGSTTPTTPALRQETPDDAQSGKPLPGKKSSRRRRHSR